MAATLEGPSGRTWLVVIRRSAEGTFFTSGWPKFVRDQALRELEFLVFRYDGDTRFTAMVFDTTACEREDLLLGGGGGPRRGRQGKKRGRATTTATSRDSKRPRKDSSVGKEMVPYRATPGDRQLQVACYNWTPEPGRKLPRTIHFNFYLTFTKNKIAFILSIPIDYRFLNSHTLSIHSKGLMKIVGRS